MHRHWKLLALQQWNPSLPFEFYSGVLCGYGNNRWLRRVVPCKRFENFRWRWRWKKIKKRIYMKCSVNKALYWDKKKQEFRSRCCKLLFINVFRDQSKNLSHPRWYINIKCSITEFHEAATASHEAWKFIVFRMTRSNSMYVWYYFVLFCFINRSLLLFSCLSPSLSLITEVFFWNYCWHTLDWWIHTRCILKRKSSSTPPQREQESFENNMTSRSIMLETIQGSINYFRINCVYVEVYKIG